MDGYGAKSAVWARARGLGHGGKGEGGEGLEGRIFAGVRGNGKGRCRFPARVACLPCLVACRGSVQFVEQKGEFFKAAPSNLDKFPERNINHV